VRTATERFALLGYSETPVSVLAEDAGVTSGTLYYYFPSKAALYEAVATEARERLCERFIEPVLAAVGEQPELASRLRTLVAVLVHRAGEDITLHRLCFTSDLEADSEPVVGAFREGIRSDLRRLYAGVAGIDPDRKPRPKEQELLSFIEALTLGVCHFAMRPRGLERLPLIEQALTQWLEGSLFDDDVRSRRPQSS
jgi:AcrR family transcriptional regulator